MSVSYYGLQYTMANADFAQNFQSLYYILDRIYTEHAAETVNESHNLKPETVAESPDAEGTMVRPEDRRQPGGKRRFLFPSRPRRFPSRPAPPPDTVEDGEPSRGLDLLV